MYWSQSSKFFANIFSVLAADKITSVPLANLEELSPTFEEDKDELEKIEEQDREINSIKTELTEIKNLLVTLVDRGADDGR